MQNLSIAAESSVLSRWHEIHNQWVKKIHSNLEPILMVYYALQEMVVLVADTSEEKALVHFLKPFLTCVPHTYGRSLP